MTRLPLANAYWVQPDRWLAGEYPGGANRDETRARLAALAALGINAYLDLTVPGELPRYDTELAAGVLHVRKPIPDHGVPLEPEHMGEIIAAIDELLGEGRRLFLHCRAGIGRTGMVVGCHLAQHGARGDAALSALEALWAGSARARSWPSIPETAEQRDYVYCWPAPLDPTLDGDAMAATHALRERFTGALLGLAAGDALAAATQYRKPGSFTPVGDLLGGGPFDLPRGAWTDDTAMALCVADSLLERDGFDPVDQVERFARWQREGYLSATGQCVGITAGVTRALGAARWRRQRYPGSHDPAQLDPEPLSRIAPVVMFGFNDPSTAIENAADVARTTCQAPLVLDACRVLATALHAAIAGRDKAAILGAVRELAAGGALRPEVTAIAAGGYRGALAGAAPAQSTALDVLACALGAFEATATLRDGALLCANRGRDSDVLTAAFGQLAGAHYGAAALPAAWRASLLKREQIVDFADRILVRVMEAMAG
ncbi:MAG: ADP-ribosylglycohydrolase family protein [Steroidobacteraceae bacterium]